MLERKLEQQRLSRRHRVFFTMAGATIFIILAAFILYGLAMPNSFDTHSNHGLRLRILHDGFAMGPSVPFDFPDPSLIRHENGTWFAFATNSRGRNIQVARSRTTNILGRWERLGIDAMPEKTWTSGRNTWAPDVKRLYDGSYIMYFAGEMPDSHQHCVGVARSDKLEGPYVADPEPWVCPREAGGAIDAAGFRDPTTGRQYVVYKVDGNSKGDFSQCGTGTFDPNLKTPLLLQEVSSYDGSTKIGAPTILLDRIPDLDGALIEAPELTIRPDGTYVLFYSSHCFTDPKYDIKYAYSKHVKGPYRRASKPLLQTPHFGLKGPGGASTGAEVGVDWLAFHANCKDKVRCMYITGYDQE